jgi:N-acetylmuramoyl-L-alanine amidase
MIRFGHFTSPDSSSGPRRVWPVGCRLVRAATLGMLVLVALAAGMTLPLAAQGAGGALAESAATGRIETLRISWRAEAAAGSVASATSATEVRDPVSVPVSFARGFAAVPATALEHLGWQTSQSQTFQPQALTFVRGDEQLTFQPESPLVSWRQDWIQLIAAPYREGSALWVPLQLLTDVIPDRLPDLVAALEADWLQVRVPAVAAPAPAPAVAPTPASPAPARLATPESAPVRVVAPEPSPVRVVIIDAGHGGRDPGSIGPTGVREKDVALAIALRIRDALQALPDFEVHMIRDDDTLVPLWERGVIATRLKGDRPGIFVSIHTNAVDGRSARGVETYFLSEARTEHESRVAALENEAASFDVVGSQVAAANPDLGFILTELRNLDHIHWSSDLAEVVQGELAPIHPGPNRGVKQGPLAVITNSVMPSILVETGFISNPDEERALAAASFQSDAAQAIVRGIVTFFERYPPGRAGSPTGTR